MRERTIIALWKRLAGGQRLRLRVVSVLVIALGSAALLMGPGIDSTARAQTTVDYDADGDGLIEVATIAQLNAIRWDLDGDGVGGSKRRRHRLQRSLFEPDGVAADGLCRHRLCWLRVEREPESRTPPGTVVTGWEPIGGRIERVHCHVRRQSAGLHGQQPYHRR